MPRIRSLHPGQWTDEDFVACSAHARLLCLGLRNEADDNGIFEWKPVQIKMRILPIDNCDVTALLFELMENRQVMKFEAGGKTYGAIRNFLKWQRPKKPNPLHPVPETVRKFIGDTAPPSRKATRKGGTSSEMKQVKQGASSEPVGNQFGTGGEKSLQKEGGRRLDVGDKKERGSESHTNTESKLDKSRSDTSVGKFSDENCAGEGKESGNGKQKRGTRLASDWETGIDERTVASEAGLPECQLNFERAKFRDYWIAQPGQRGVKLDWDATWRNWIRKAGEDYQRRNGNSRSDRSPQGVGSFTAALGRAIAQN